MRRPQLMGVLNATPDSLFEKGAYFSLEKGIERGLKLAKEGADSIDIGGASSRPGAEQISVEEELSRVLPLIEALSSQVAVPLSIDTTKVEVARQALGKGAKMINDITGFQDPEMRSLASTCDADLCVMHMQGTPGVVPSNPCYPDGVVEEILRFFERQIGLLTKEGVKESRIILDPGIGFGKSIEHYKAVFQAIDRFKAFGLRVMIGASRKGFMTRILGTPPQELLAPTLAVHTIAALRGADILRTHDVKEHFDALKVAAHFF